MSSRLDEIIEALRGGHTTIDEACRAIAAAARENPSGTRMWPMLIDSRVTQQQISLAAGRALTDAMETYEPEKTMWLGPSKIAKASESDAIKNKTFPSTGNVLHVPTSTAKESTEPKPHFQDTEQLRAFLWDSQPKKSEAKATVTPLVTPTEPVEWMQEANAPRVPSPRPMPGATQALPAPDLGTIIKNRYRLDAHLGYGGIGQVFSATDLEMERTGRGDARVTLKLIAVDLKREPQALFAIQNAVTQIKSLRHPNIITTYSVERDNDRLFVVMEPLTGHWLGDRIRQIRGVGMSQDIAWPIISGIANGLAHAHKQDIVHSDLSPYAVFVADDGTPKIIGFGLIHALPTSNEAMDLLDTMTWRAYSEAYTADTWATHAIPHAADDLYPLGVIAYELLTGTHPFGRHSLTTARQKNLAWEPIADLHPRAAKLISRCLSFERKERPKNATRFLKRMQGPAWLKWLVGDRLSIANRES